MFCSYPGFVRRSTSGSAGWSALKIIMRMINPMNSSEKTVLTIPVTSPAILRPRPAAFFLRAMIARMIAGIPRKRPGPVNDTVPSTIEAMARLLSDCVVGCSFITKVNYTISIVVLSTIMYYRTSHYGGAICQVRRRS